MSASSNVWRAVLFEGEANNPDAALREVLNDLPNSPAGEEGIECEIDCLIVVNTDNQRISFEDSTVQLLSMKNYALSLDVYLSQDNDNN